MKRILIIDDEKDVLMLLKILLEESGFEVATLSRASTAFLTVEAFKPDLILLDVQLAEYDGRDICLELKSSNKTKIVKIILFSGHLENYVGYEEYGADDFIGKPFEFKSLLKKINYHLKDD